MAQQENPDRQPGLWTEVGPGPVEEGWGSKEKEYKWLGRKYMGQSVNLQDQNRSFLEKPWKIGLEM